ncbi:hypothetical protein BJ322DRAFT_1016665 [Thelephora terrestris]|uniref:Uncharacterized protein n=1 Tax=Thelephora terrestris TaxID=56493 RepID=A0A9P6HRH9_9AGAM|nr:hypothetical protein BJ322DRAFT_1016665 [Thelephora terrestris]
MSSSTPPTLYRSVSRHERVGISASDAIEVTLDPGTSKSRDGQRLCNSGTPGWHSGVIKISPSADFGLSALISEMCSWNTPLEPSSSPVTGYGVLVTPAPQAFTEMVISGSRQMRLVIWLYTQFEAHKRSLSPRSRCISRLLTQVSTFCWFNWKNHEGVVIVAVELGGANPNGVVSGEHSDVSAHPIVTLGYPEIQEPPRAAELVEIGGGLASGLKFEGEGASRT